MGKWYNNLKNKEIVMKFEWDEEKNIKNIIKHGIDFNEAVTIFFNDYIEIPDLEHSNVEDRFTAFGISSLLRELVVCYCVREKIDGNNIIRIITARKANQNERKVFFDER